MLRFKVQNVVPPGGKYFYFVEPTQSYFEAFSLEDVYWRVRENLLANGLQVPENLKALIIDHICRHVPEKFCKGESDGRPRAHTLTMFQIQEFTSLLFKRFTTSKERFFVGQLEAVRRAEICVKCPENNRTLCTTCNGLKPWAAKLVSRRKTLLDKFLGVCTICGCVLSAKIHVNAEFLKGAGKTKYPSNCWLHEAAEVDNE